MMMMMMINAKLPPAQMKLTHPASAYGPTFSVDRFDDLMPLAI